MKHFRTTRYKAAAAGVSDVLRRFTKPIEREITGCTSGTAASAVPTGTAVIGNIAAPRSCRTSANALGVLSTT